MPTNDIQKFLFSYLDKYGKQLVKTIKQEIKTNNKIASKELYNSIDYKIVTSDTNISLEIIAAEQLTYVEGGRRAGVKQPPIQPIIKWIFDKKILRKKNKGVPKMSKKLSSKTKKKSIYEDKEARSIAFAIAKSISQRGIRPTPIIQPAIDLTNTDFFEGLENELTKGIAQLFALEFAKDIISDQNIRVSTNIIE